MGGLGLVGNQTLDIEMIHTENVTHKHTVKQRDEYEETLPPSSDKFVDGIYVEEIDQSQPDQWKVVVIEEDNAYNN